MPLLYSDLPDRGTRDPSPGKVEAVSAVHIREMTAMLEMTCELGAGALPGA